MAGDHDLYSLLVDMAVRERNETDLEKYLEPAERTAERVEHPLFQALVARAKGVAKRLSGDEDGAATLLQEALEGFRELKTQWQIGRTLGELAELNAANGATEEARGYYDQALEAFGELRAVPDSDRVRATLASLG